MTATIDGWGGYMSDAPRYLDPEWPEFDPEWHTKGKRCAYVYESSPRKGRQCGLLVWKDAPESLYGDPRCVFHS